MDKTSIYTYFEIKKKLQNIFNLFVYNIYLYSFTYFFITTFFDNHIIFYHFKRKMRKKIEVQFKR